MKYWKRIDANGKTTTVESYSHNLAVKDAIEITKVEFDAYMDSLPLPITEPSYSNHISVLVAVDPVKARPARIKRVWESREYFYDCFATQTVKDEFIAGKIVVGDYVLVHFDDVGEQLVTAKVWKSW